MPRIGLITNQTGCDQSGRRTVDILRDHGLRILYILAPEHGFDGKVPAGKPVANGVDRKTGIPIVSVYGRGGDYSIVGKRLDPAIVKQLDALVYDIQDAGMRHYTYISTMLCALEASAEFNKPLIILDRPNLLGAHMEGPLVDPGLNSFISMVSIPLRHGMTAGELALYFNKYILQKPAPIHIVPMKEYTRTNVSPFLAKLSPNIPSQQASYGYSFLGMLGEVAPFDVGIGTQWAFQMILLPDSLRIPPFEWHKLAALLKKYNIQSHPDMLSRKAHTASGLRLQFPDNAQFASFELLVDVLDFFKQRGVSFSFSRIFDKAAGTTKLREWCGNVSDYSQLADLTKMGLEQFYAKAKPILLYEPNPQIIFLKKKGAEKAPSSISLKT